MRTSPRSTAHLLARVIPLLLTAAVVLDVALPQPALAAGARRPESGASAPSVRLHADGRVTIAMTITCPRNRADDFTAVNISLAQHEAGSFGADTVSPLPCTGRPRRMRFEVPMTLGSRFQEGAAELLVRTDTHCRETPTTVSGPCRDQVLYAYQLDLVARRALHPLPRLTVSRVRLRRDGSVTVKATTRCERNRADDFSMLRVDVSQFRSPTEPPTADAVVTRRPASCNGRDRRVTVRLRSRTEAPFERGPATVGVQLLSSCREAPDSEGTVFDVCLDEAAHRFAVAL